MIFVILFLPHI